MKKIQRLNPILIPVYNKNENWTYLMVYQIYIKCMLSFFLFLRWYYGNSSPQARLDASGKYSRYFERNIFFPSSGLFVLISYLTHLVPFLLISPDTIPIINRLRSETFLQSKNIDNFYGWWKWGTFFNLYNIQNRFIRTKCNQVYVNKQ